MVAMTVAFVKLRPKSVDLAYRMASGWLFVAKRRQTAWMSPFLGSTAMVVPWLMALDSESLMGAVQVFPQSSDRVNMILEDGEALFPVKSEYMK